MEQLRIRAYNVRFGDAILVTIPDLDDAGNPAERHLLIDVGNVLATSGGQNDVFEPIFKDIMAQTNGAIDLYVSTHEHLDHVQGLLFAHKDLGIELEIRQMWLTASAEGKAYYDNHPEAKRKFDLARALVADIEHRLPLSLRDASVEVLLANNGFPGARAVSTGRTDDCVAFLKEHTNPEGAPSPKAYVHRREAGNPWPHPFRTASLDVWAPEEDTAVYYGRFQPSSLGAAPPGAGGIGDGSDADLTPPPGVDAVTFYNLVDMRTRGFWDNLLAIDKARNNTSIVFCLKWNGWKLLFPGDAEVRSYKEMQKRGVLESVHFLKVGHHGSHNGTPPDQQLEAILPLEPPEDLPRFALVSTADETYPNVPDPHTIDDRLASRCTVTDTRDLPPGGFTDMFFPPM